MKLREVVHSCSNPRVAEAALASIGGAVAAYVRAVAARNGAAPGDLVAQLVGEFRERACPSVWMSAEQAMCRSELPVLIGLQHIVTDALVRRALSDRGETAGEPATIPIPGTQNQKSA